MRRGACHDWWLPRASSARTVQIRVGLGVSLSLVLSLNVIAAAPKLPPDRFDLQCKISRILPRAKSMGEKHFRIDLQAKAWCEDRCEATSDLVLQDEDLVLNLADMPEGPARVHRVISFSRRTADLRDERITTLDGDLVGTELLGGRCRLRPFSGIGKKLF